MSASPSVPASTRSRTIVSTLRLDSPRWIEAVTCLVQNRHTGVGFDARDKRNIPGAKHAPDDRQCTDNTCRVFPAGRLAKKEDRERSAEKGGKFIRSPA
jgi:hypothetical protein